MASFGTGDGTLALDVETGAGVAEANRAGYAAWVRNLTRIEADAAAVPEAKVGDLSAAIHWWDGEAVDLKKVGLRGVHATIPVHGKQNQWEQVAIAPGELLGTASPGPGIFYLALRAPEEPQRPDVYDRAETRDGQPRARELLLNFTNLGVTAKLAGPSGLIWVTRLSDGQPQAGAAITIRDAKGKIRWHGTTGADGVAVTPGRAQLLPPKKAIAAAPRADFVGDNGGGDDDEGEGDFAGGDFTGQRAADLLVFARVGNDVTWVNPTRVGGLASWNFHVTADSVVAHRGAARFSPLRSRAVPPRRHGPPARPRAHDEAGQRAAGPHGAQGGGQRARSAAARRSWPRRFRSRDTVASRSTSRPPRGRALVTTA